jgi:GNAT superfamily N-acetyltransferase
MVLEDAPHVATLSGQLGYPSTPAEIENRFRALAADADSSLLVAAGPDGRVVGWIHVFGNHLLESDPAAEVGGLVVDEQLRGQGVGSTLLREAERWAAEHGYREVWIRSNVIRKETHGFYQRKGYEILKSQLKFRKRPA